MIQGIYDASGYLCVDEVGAIAAWTGGLPYVASGALAVRQDAAPAAGQAVSGLRFASTGRLCISLAAAAADHYENGLSFDSSGRLRIVSGGTVAAQGTKLMFISGDRICTTIFRPFVREAAGASDGQEVAKL